MVKGIKDIPIGQTGRRLGGRDRSSELEVCWHVPRSQRQLASLSPSPGTTGINQIFKGMISIRANLVLLLNQFGDFCLQLFALGLFLGKSFFQLLDASVEGVDLLLLLSGFEQWLKVFVSRRARIFRTTHLDLAIKFEPIPSAKSAPRTDVALQDEQSSTLLDATLDIGLNNEFDSA